MMDLSSEPTSLYGAITALLVFAIFIGTWWWYGMRATTVRKMLREGDAILVDVDPPREFAEHHVDGAVNVPLDVLEERAGAIVSDRRLVVVCANSELRAARGASKLRKLGYQVRNLGHVHSV